MPYQWRTVSGKGTAVSLGLVMSQRERQIYVVLVSGYHLRQDVAEDAEGQALRQRVQKAHCDVGVGSVWLLWCRCNQQSLLWILCLLSEAQI